ncbi:MAG: DUF3606 domain-containing protein [Ideonella sp.]|nr:DUF3606 domain-containing protein [Ideonella sp.]
MPDDPNNRGAADRREVSMQDHEVRNMAQKHGVTPERVRETMKRVGNDREKVEAALRGSEKN